ncbi:DUF1501 domain-containing protein [Chromobacterium haemolyticum]|uniref:Twin-arginine translocation pathway signal sequence domain-containing protein n=1 Tax=Chromobacterium haemolyticum TaxID=394935 RepID=A0A1W0D695_9NEIS|nr:DUF1501 domain-containing protein [Chromobacterium haemolyticum]OQS42463.1 Twin-arginine translocation pathway signal sequence domain-containing protein [Chromobacterium haemolyticum]
MFQRRQFLKAMAGGLMVSVLPNLSWALAPAGYRRLLVLIELKGGNDGLNTVVPYASADYYRLRPGIAIPREQVLPLDERLGLHPAMTGLLPLWQQRELAVLQGVGYPDPNLSHFRSIEIWETASNSQQYLSEGWLSRLFREQPTPHDFAADGVVLSSQALGPLDGGARAVVLSNPQDFARQAKLAADQGHAGSGALGHILKVEGDIRQAAAELGQPAKPLAAADSPMAAPRPTGAFAQAVATLADTLSRGVSIAVARITLTGFDTHGNQPPTQARLLGELADGIALLRTQLQQQGHWDDTLVLSYAEFGRRPRENGNRGTDHGTANVHFASGGRVRGGLYGQSPQLAGVSDGNLPYAIDFRQVYATAIQSWWGKDTHNVLGGRFAPLPLLKT